MELQQLCQDSFHPGLFLFIDRVPFWPPCSSPGTSLVSAACRKDDSRGNMSAPWAEEEDRMTCQLSSAISSHIHTNTHEPTAGWWAAVLVLNRKRSRDICLVSVPSYFVCLILKPEWCWWYSEPFCVWWQTETSDQSESTEAIKHFSVNSLSYSGTHVTRFWWEVPASWKNSPEERGSSDCKSVWRRGILTDPSSV